MGSLINEFSILNGENCIDGFYFLKKLVFLQTKVMIENDQKKQFFSQLKKDKMELYRYEECLPKTLGR
jgi:hypothetical protein